MKYILLVEQKLSGYVEYDTYDEDLTPEEVNVRVKQMLADGDGQPVWEGGSHQVTAVWEKGAACPGVDRSSSTGAFEPYRWCELHNAGFHPKDAAQCWVAEEGERMCR